MRPLRALGIYVVAVFIGGALLAPWLYWLAQAGAQYYPHIANSPFHRFVNRALLGLALLGLWPLLWAMGVTSWRDLGLVSLRGQVARLVNGFLLGFASLTLVALAALAAGARALPENPGSIHLFTKLGTAALSAVVVAVIEEILFRGGLFGALRKAFNWKWGLVISSAIYGLVHFMESARQTGPVHWTSGLELLPRMLSGFGQVQELVPGFLNLMLAGVILAVAYHRTGNLFFSIGLHAGWIFWLKSYGVLTRPVPGTNVWLWGGDRMINGWLALPVLAGALLVVLQLTRRKGTEEKEEKFERRNQEAEK